MEEFNCSYIRFKALSQIISLWAITQALGITAALGLRPCSVGEHQVSCHTTLLWWNLPPSHTKTLSPYKLCQCQFAGAHGNKKSALSGRGFHCLSWGSKTLERPVELPCNHMKSHLALIGIDKSRRVLLEIELRFVQKKFANLSLDSCLQQAAFSVGLQVSWANFSGLWFLIPIPPGLLHCVVTRHDEIK